MGHFNRLLVGILILTILLTLGAKPSLAHVQLLKPNGGEILESGATYQIGWRVVIQHSLVNWDLHYSITGPAGPWIPISIDLPPGDPSSGSEHFYDWSVPFDDSDSVRVRITMDNSGGDYTDISDADLEITSEFSSQRFCFFLDPQQADACVGSGGAGRGSCVAILNGDQSQLTIFVEHDVANPIGAEIRLGEKCESGGTAHALTGYTSPIFEIWNLDSADVVALLADSLYIEILSSDVPAGEIRGQFEQEPIKFLFELDESQANAGMGTGSFYNGYALGELDEDGTNFSLEIYHDVPSGDITGAHIHFGAKGVNGSAQFTISNPASTISQSWGMLSSDVISLLGGNYYVNIHTSDFPAGEIRGQITRETRRYAFTLNEDALSGGEAFGFCVIELTENYDSLHIYCEHDATSAIAGNVHLGVTGESGPLAFTFADVTSPINETWDISSTDLNALLSDSFYVNIHSAEFANGEIRGQIDQQPIEISFGINESQANACAGTGSSAFGDGLVSLKNGAKELTIFLTHDLTDPAASHIHFGGECVNGPALFTFDSPVSPIENIWYISFDDVANFMRGELYANIHSTSFPAGEIRGQLISNPYICGDVNGDGTANIFDVTFLISFLYKGGPAPEYLEAADVNGDSLVNIFDTTYLISFLYKDGPDPSCP